MLKHHQATSVRRGSLYASLPCRFLAFLIDSTIMVFIQTLALYFMVGIPEEIKQEPEFLNFHINYLSYNLNYVGQLLNLNLYFLVFHWLYYAIMESSEKQGTIGKRAMGIKVGDLKGRRITFWRASLRYFGKYLSTIVLFGGFVLAFYTRRRQTLHDLLTNCVVIIG